MTPGAFTDSAAAASRILTKLRHDPAAIALTVGAPVVLVLVFGYIFGSAIAVPGAGDYREYLVPGLLVTIAFNVIPSMVATARDADRGVVDRFRSMPISRVAVPFGQAMATVFYGALCLVLMGLCGLVVGWRIRNGLGPALGGFALLLAGQFAITWVGMYLGLVVGKEETAAQLSPLVIPVAMLSNIFVPTSGMPGWLRVLADWNPFSAYAAAVRGLAGNPSAPTNGAWPLENPVAASLIWTTVLLAVFVPLTTARFSRPS